MRQLNLNMKLGVVALIAGAFLALVAIPSWVSSPSNVRNIILSPTFWPYVLSGLLVLTGVLLLFMPQQEDPLDTPSDDTAIGPGAARLIAMGVIMVLTMYALPRLGMVWTCMVTFLACAFLFRTRFPVAAVICAVVIPLVLYAFFAHVAGVAIPQGEFVRLP